MALFAKGITLTQHKEPALSNKLVSYLTPEPFYFKLGKEVPENIADLTSRDIISIAKAAQITDEGDGRQLVSKLRRAEKKKMPILVDAIDDEPYVSSKLVPLLQLSDLVRLGIDLCRLVTESSDVVIQTYRDLGEVYTTIPSKLGPYRIERLKGGYPMLPSAKTSEAERLVVGSGALVHLARAVTEHKPQSTTFVTVAGNCVAHPMNLEVSLGMSVAEILERCGLLQEPTRVIRGGPMTGFAVIDTEQTLVTPTTRAILAMRGEAFRKTYSCINCGRCEEACPSGLNPRHIRSLVISNHYHQLIPFDPQYCIGCGTCSYVCPSRINVVKAMHKAKAYLHKQLAESELAETEDGSEV